MGLYQHEEYQYIHTRRYPYLSRQIMTREEADTQHVDQMKKFFTKTVLPTPAYQFFMQYAEVMENIGRGELSAHVPGYSKDAMSFLSDFSERVSKAGSQDINKELRLIEIEEDLIPLLENTDNKIFYRPLFFPTVFINNDFIFQNFIIKGLLIEDVPKEKDLLIYMIGIDTNTYDMVASMIALTAEETTLFQPLKREIGGETDTLNNHIKLLTCNIIDMIEGNDEDLEVTTIVTTPEQNAKIIKRGKIPFPTKIFIRANKKFKQYIKDFNEENEECKDTKLTCKFLVRGHWMHFRSERYTRKQGEKVWVKPFYKGQGIVVSKTYKVTK